MNNQPQRPIQRNTNTSSAAQVANRSHLNVTIIPLSRSALGCHFQFSTTSLRSVESRSVFISGDMDGPLTIVRSATYRLNMAMTGIHVAHPARLSATLMATPGRYALARVRSCLAAMARRRRMLRTSDLLWARKTTARILETRASSMGAHQKSEMIHCHGAG
jgi:hypothetical protein